MPGIKPGEKGQAGGELDKLCGHPETKQKQQKQKNFYR
jgi:hypothetical protein